MTPALAGQQLYDWAIDRKLTRRQMHYVAGLVTDIRLQGVEGAVKIMEDIAPHLHDDDFPILNEAIAIIAEQLAGVASAADGKAYPDGEA